MRLAVLIIAVATFALMSPMSCLAGLSEDTILARGAGIASLSLVFGAAFIMHFPLVSVIIFFIGSIINLYLAISSGDSLLLFWGGALWLLTFLSILGYFELRKKRQK